MTTNLDDIAKGYNDARKGIQAQNPGSYYYMMGYNRAKARAAGGKS